MKALVFKWLAITACVLGVILGCRAAYEQATESASGNDDGGGTITGSNFALVESDFSDAPVSPGGTGGLAADDDDEVVVMVDDVEVTAEETSSFFTAFQIDPEAEDTAGPKFVVAGDVDRDGLLDLVSGWNQSQPVQLHLQRRDADDNISFRTITLAGTSPVAVIAGVELGQINDDHYPDVVVLSKATGNTTWCPPEEEGGDPTQISVLEGEILIYFSPGSAELVPDGDAWTEMTLINPFIADTWIHNQYPGREDVNFDDSKTQPEWSGFTDLIVADIDGRPCGHGADCGCCRCDDTDPDCNAIPDCDGIYRGCDDTDVNCDDIPDCDDIDCGCDDIVVALNPGTCKTLGQDPAPINTVDLWTNPGPDLATSSHLWGAPPPSGQSRNVPIALLTDVPAVKDIAVMDIDSDGDLDVVATYTNSISLNVRWARNPLIPHIAGGAGGYDEVIAGISDGWRFRATGWEERPIGAIDTAADILALGDMDGDGFDDIVVRSTVGQIVQWFRRPNALTIQPEFPPNDPVPDRFNFPWPVFTLTEFSGQEPEAIAIGDVTGDGQVDLAIAAEGAVFWYDGTSGETLYDPWIRNTIIQDSAAETTDPSLAGPGGTGVGVTEVDTSTSINTLLIVDLDQDGRNDIIGTLDRRSGAGLSDDRLVWYRNIRTEEEEEVEEEAEE